MSRDEAVAVIRSGMRIFVHGAAATPTTLLEALTRRTDLEGVTVYHRHTAGPAPFAEPGKVGQFRSVSLFTGAPLRTAIDEGRADCVPIPPTSGTSRSAMPTSHIEPRSSEFAMHASTRILIGCASLLVAGGIVHLAAQPAPARPASVTARLDAVLKTAPVIDGHNDLPWEMRQRVKYDFDRLDVGKPQPQLMTDIPRLREGRVGGQFWSVYVPADLQGDAAVSATLEQIDAVHEMVRRYPSAFALTRTADEVERAMAAGKVASMMGIEGGHSIDSSIATLRMLHRLGAGYMTLTHGKNVPWGDSATDVPKVQGLSPFGEEIVREMNRLGMLVDLSHVSPDTMVDAIRVSQAPVIFSHSNARAVCDVARNVPDDILRQMPRNGGIVMVTFVPGFVAPEAAAHSRRATAETQRLRTQYPDDASAQKKALDAWTAANRPPRARLAQVADHIDHIRKVAGIDHIGLGGDFDGITSVVQGLENVSTYPALLAELARRGYSDQEIAKITSRNILRVMRAAETVATRLQSTVTPSTKTIEDVDRVTRKGQPVPPAR